MEDEFCCLGLQKPNTQEVHEGYDAVMRTHYVDTFALFERRVDELLQTLDRVC